MLFDNISTTGYALMNTLPPIVSVRSHDYDVGEKLVLPYWISAECSANNHRQNAFSCQGILLLCLMLSAAVNE